MDSLKPFPYLSDRKEKFELLWIGPIYKNMEDDSNNHLECIFQFAYPTPYKYEEWEFGSDYLQASQVNIRIGVGYLPALCLGDMYKKGKKRNQPNENYSIGRNKIIEVDVDTGNILNECLLDEVINSQELFFCKFAHLAKSPVKVLSGHIKTQEPISRPHRARDSQQVLNGDQISLLFPEIELLRFYYAKSTKLSKAIFNGHFRSDLIPIFITNEIHEKPRFIDTKFRFCYRHGFSEAEALILGRVLASNTALKAVQRVHNTIQVGRVNLEKNIFFRTDFPFLGKSRLKIRGQLGLINNKNVFLVQQILSCSGAFPFTALSYCDEIQNGNPNPDGEPMKGGLKPPPRTEENKQADSDTGKSTSTEGPDDALKPLTLKIASSEFDIEHISRKSEKFKPSTHTSDPQPPRSGHTGEDVSTGDPKKNGSLKSSQKIIDESQLIDPDPGSNITQLVNAIRESNFSKNFSSIQSLPLLGASLNSSLNEWLIKFPLLACKVKIKYKIFSFLDENSSGRRRLICFALKYKKNNELYYFYVFIAEIREKIKFKNIDDINKTDNSYDELPVILLFKNNMDSIKDEDLETFITETVKTEMWPSYNLDPNKNTIMLHSNDAASITKRLLKTIKEKVNSK